MKSEHPTTNADVSKSNAAGFDWPLAYEAEAFLRKHVELFLEQNSFARELSARMRNDTGTDFFEWIDHLVLSPDDEQGLRESGFSLDAQVETAGGESVYEHPRATLPRVLLRAGPQGCPSVVALRPEFVADFVARHNLRNEPEGEPFSRYRRIVVAEEKGTRLEAVERRSYRGFVPGPLGRVRFVRCKRALLPRRRLAFLCWPSLPGLAQCPSVTCKHMPWLPFRWTDLSAIATFRGRHLFILEAELAFSGPTGGYQPCPPSRPTLPDPPFRAPGAPR